MSSATDQPTLKPMSMGLSLAYFGIPAIILVVFVYGLNPVFTAAGSSPIMAHMLASMIPLILMFAAALFALKSEGNPISWLAIRQRFRVHRMSGRDWLWTVGFTILALGVYGGLLNVERALVLGGVIPLPAFVPLAIDPRLTPDLNGIQTLVGGPIVGNWAVVIVNIILLFFNIFGEEFWWRGVILPRQELAFGKWTWALHGVLWCLFHAFKYWDYIALLPVTLLLSYVVQRRQNTTIGLIMHGVINGLGVLSFGLLAAGIVKM